MADAGVGEVDKAPRHATGGHEGTSQQEERNRQQGVVLGSLEQLDRQ